jgi:hypothetical protein
MTQPILISLKMSSASPQHILEDLYWHRTETNMIGQSYARFVSDRAGPGAYQARMQPIKFQHPNIGRRFALSPQDHIFMGILYLSTWRSSTFSDRDVLSRT